MKKSTSVDVTCNDFLKDNQRLYAHKARRKKIALIHVEVDNQCSTEVQLMLGESKLIATGRSYNVEPPAKIIRKLSEFTWDMAIFLILDFHPVLSTIDFLILVTGPLYNWRLTKRLRSLTDGELILKPGKRVTALLGFRRVSKKAEQIEIVFRGGDGERKVLTCDIG